MADSTFELEVYNAGRCFANAQLWLSQQGTRIDTIYPDVMVGWHDTDVDEHKGSFALAQVGTSWEDLVGNRIRVSSRAGRGVYAYVFGAADVPTGISLAFGCWVRLTYPSVRSMQARIEVLS